MVIIAHNLKRQLAQVTKSILDDRRAPYTLRNEILEMFRLLQAGSTFQFEKVDIGRGETHSEQGLAISPTNAAMCAEDFARTVVFIRGLHGAIREVAAVQEQQSTGGPVQVLYAGTGPYATLAIPLMTVLPEETVTFELIDLHQSSMDSVTALINSFGLQGYVSEQHVTDACQFEISQPRVPDVIVTETMAACLAKEPQVAISRNLLSQAPSAVLVPRRVTVKAIFVDTSREFTLADAEDPESPVEPKRQRIELGAIFELTREHVAAWRNETNDALPGGQIEIPSTEDARHQLKLYTEIEVWGRHQLSDYDCSLTIPRRLELDHPVEAGDQIQFRYQLGSRPRLVGELMRE